LAHLKGDEKQTALCPAPKTFFRQRTAIFHHHRGALIPVNTKRSTQFSVGTSSKVPLDADLAWEVVWGGYVAVGWTPMRLCVTPHAHFQSSTNKPFCAPPLLSCRLWKGLLVAHRRVARVLVAATKLESK